MRIVELLGSRHSNALAQPGGLAAAARFFSGFAIPKLATCRPLGLTARLPFLTRPGNRRASACRNCAAALVNSLATGYLHFSYLYKKKPVQTFRFA
jgi:hypothetical protein